MRVQIAVAVGVLIEVEQLQPGFELAGQLFVRGVGELDAAVVLLQLAHLALVLEWIKGQGVDDLRLVLVERVVEAVVQPRQQPPAGLQDPRAFAPDRQHRVDIAVGDGMEDEIEAVVVERQALGHIRVDDGDVIALALRDHALRLQLLFRVVEHGAFGAQRGKDGHLLPAAGGQTQHTSVLQIPEPVVRDELYRRELHVPLPVLCRCIDLAGDGLAPLPAVVHPAVNGLTIDILIGNFHKGSFPEQSQLPSFASFQAT